MLFGLERACSRIILEFPAPLVVLLISNKVKGWKCCKEELFSFVDFFKIYYLFLSYYILLDYKNDITFWSSFSKLMRWGSNNYTISDDKYTNNNIHGPISNPLFFPALPIFSCCIGHLLLLCCFVVVSLPLLPQSYSMIAVIMMMCGIGKTSDSLRRTCSEIKLLE